MHIGSRGIRVATLGYLGGAVALLALSGWLIGWQIARSGGDQSASQILVVTELVHNEPLRRALQRIGVAPHRVQICSSVSGPVENAVTLTIDAKQTATCTPAKVTPHSYALQTVPGNASESAPDWEAIARTIAFQLPVDANIRKTQHDRGSHFEQYYRSAWLKLQREDAKSLRSAYSTLNRIITQWPAGREADKSIALANHADLCIRLNEAPTSRLARMLEGYAAAQEALRLQYALPEHARIEGLRPLVERYRRAIHGYESGNPERETVSPRTSAIGETHDRPAPFAMQRIASCPQADATRRQPNHAPEERYRL